VQSGAGVTLLHTTGARRPLVSVAMGHESSMIGGDA
jgi:hypothetical protein